LLSCDYLANFDAKKLLNFKFSPLFPRKIKLPKEIKTKFGGLAAVVDRLELVDLPRIPPPLPPAFALD
jgi:hypothetical protein